MGNYQSRTSQVLQDVWREEWQGALDGADRALSEDMRALTAAPGEDWTELMILCQKNGTPDDIRRLAGQPGVDINKATSRGYTALHVCSVTKGSKGLLAILLTLGADMALKTKLGNSALHLAACAGLESNMQTLLIAPHANASIRSQNDITPLHVASAFGNERVVQVLLKYKADVNAVDKLNFTPLLVACHLGHKRVVEILLSNGALPTHASQQGDTALHLAAFSNQRDICELLIRKYNVDVNTPDKEKHTPLHYACRRGYLDVTQLLLSHGANAMAKNAYSDTPLHLACYNGWVGICQALVATKSVDLGVENGYSETPLHAACTSGQTQTLILFLLGQQGVSINKQGRDGHTPLHSACYHGHLHVVATLLERGADFRLTEKKNGAPPIKWAFERGYDEIVELLRAYYAHDTHAADQTDQYETPSPIGKIRHVTKEKAEMFQLRDVLSDIDGQISNNDIDFYEVIGQGSFGAVYKGKYKNQTIAIKKLRPGALKAKSDIEKFCREVKILCDLKHANVISFIGACTKEPSQFCIVTEFARGGSLHAVLYKQKRVLDTQRKVEIAIDVASGMNYLHSLENPIIHRDLNPHNILLNEKGQALVADFGESRLLIKMSSGMDEMTKQTGNLRYMAPEVFGTNGAYSEKADVFSYGLCLWELFAEATPFEDVLAAAAAAEMAYNDLRPYVPPSWPRELTVLIASCWHVTPSNRPAFSEILKTLQTELRGLSAPVATLASEPDPNELVGSRNGSLRLRSNSVRSDTANSSDYVEVRKVRPTLRLASTDRRPFSWNTASEAHNGGAGDGADEDSPVPASS